MKSSSIRHRATATAIGLTLLLVIAGCSSGGEIAATGSELGQTLVVGSQAYYSNEIVAEIYAQALESGGYKVNREFQIGQREIYLPELTDGRIDVFPEYIGSLLQSLSKDAKGGSPDRVFGGLQKALPDNLRVLERSAAADQNSWTVTKKFAEKYKLTDLASLKNVTEALTVGGNSELETRPYGPKALEEKYGIKIKGFKAVEDSGGPLTVKALTSGAIQLANIYTADPNIAANNLISLSDPDALFLPDNIAPIVSAKVDKPAEDILNTVSRNLTQADLVMLNAKSVNDKSSSKDLAFEWLAGMTKDAAPVSTAPR